MIQSQYDPNSDDGPNLIANRIRTYGNLIILIFKVADGQFNYFFGKYI